MGSAFHQLCPRYSGTINPTAPTAIRLWKTFTFLDKQERSKISDEFEFLTRRYYSVQTFSPFSDETFPIGLYCDNAISDIVALFSFETSSNLLITRKGINVGNNSKSGRQYLTLSQHSPFVCYFVFI